jgi:hypothetical protein
MGPLAAINESARHGPTADARKLQQQQHSENRGCARMPQGDGGMPTFAPSNATADFWHQCRPREMLMDEIESAYEADPLFRRLAPNSMPHW